MKRFFLTVFCIVAISGGIFYAVSVRKISLPAIAVGGVLDLRSADLSANAFSLGGEWEFYWSRLYEPKDFRHGEGPPEGKTLITVPQSWHFAGYPRTGYATYRLTLIAPDGVAPNGVAPGGVKLMLYIPEIMSSAAVWVGGEKVFSAGTVGDRDSFVPYAKSDIVILPVRGDVGDAALGVPFSTEIIVQVSDYEKAHGGIRYPFRVGRESTLPRAVFGRWIMLSFVAGAFFIMGLYHLALFMYRPTRDYLIYPLFAAGCMLVAIRFIIEQDSIAPYFLRGSLNAHIEPIYWAVFSLHCCAVLIFSLIAFEIKLARRAKIALAAMLGLPMVLLLVLPAPMSYFITPSLYYVPYTVTIIFIAGSLSLERVRGRPYLGLYFVSLVFFFIWAPLANLTLKAQFFVAYILGNTILMLSQFAMLSQDYTEARMKAHELAAKTDFYHRMAHSLLTPLTVVSTSVQVANMVPEKAPLLLKKAQSEIMKMSEMINDALDDSAGG